MPKYRKPMRRQIHSGEPVDSAIDRNAIERREIIIAGTIDQHVMYYLTRLFRYFAAVSKDPITVILNTPGGSIVDGLAIYDLIRMTTARGIKVNILAMGSCMSMGSIILQAATHRACTKNTAFLLHEVQTITIGTSVRSMSEEKDRQGDLERVQAVLNDILAQRTGMPEKKLRKLYERRDLYLTAQDALQYKLVDEVIDYNGRSK